MELNVKWMYESWHDPYKFIRFIGFKDGVAIVEFKITASIKFGEANLMPAYISSNKSVHLNMATIMWTKQSEKTCTLWVWPLPRIPVTTRMALHF